MEDATQLVTEGTAAWGSSGSGSGAASAAENGTPQAVEDLSMGDLFGDDDDADGGGAGASAEGASGAAPAPAFTVADIFGGDVSDDAEGGDLQPSALSGHKRARSGEVKTSVYLPSHPRPQTTSGARVSLARFPRILAVAPRLYDPETYNEEEENAYLAKVNKTSARESMVRYRLKRDAQGEVVLGADGEPLKESNARIVQWNDGSLTLHVGTEVFSLRRAAKGALEDNASTGAGAGAGAGAAAAAEEAPGATVTTEYSYLFASVKNLPPDDPAKRETVLEAHAAVSSRLVAGALTGSAVSQQSVLSQRAAGSRAAKRARVAQIALVEDLEQEKMNRIKLEDEAARMAAMSRRKADALRSGSGGGGGSGGYGDDYRSGSGAGAGADEGEEVGEEDVMNLGRLKAARKGKAGGARGGARAGAGAGSGAGAGGGRKAAAAAAKDEDEEEEEEAGSGSDSGEDSASSGSSSGSESGSSSGESSSESGSGED